jgi:uncharacterized iron-regulated membrane protein
MHVWLRRLHRWFGLFTAVFLFLAGATGALIAWDHELDALLAPELYHARTDGPALPAAALADRLEAEDPRFDVTWLPLAAEPGHTLMFGVLPKDDPATGEPFDLGFDQLAVDPATGEVQGRRTWGEPGLAPSAWMPFLYKLHYSLHLPQIGGIEAGNLFMGLVAIVWLLDGFVALALAFPNPAQWRRSFAFRFRQGTLKALFDVHRSGGVWAWSLLVLLATTAVSMNLGEQVVRPVVEVFSSVEPSAWDREPPPVAPHLGRAEIVALAEAEGRRQGLAAPPGGMFYAREEGFYGVGYFAPGNDHGDVGLGNAWLYFDAATGAPFSAEVPGTGSAGDVFLALQFPVHSGRIFGTAGRIAVTALGVFIAALSATGVYLWARRQRLPGWTPRTSGTG